MGIRHRAGLSGVWQLLGWLMVWESDLKTNFFLRQFRGRFFWSADRRDGTSRCRRWRSLPGNRAELLQSLRWFSNRLARDPTWVFDVFVVKPEDFNADRGCIKRDGVNPFHSEVAHAEDLIVIDKQVWASGPAIAAR